MDFAISGSETEAGLSRQFAHAGAISLNDFLTESSASKLLAELEESDEWLEIFTASGKTYEMRAAEYEALPREQRIKLAELSHAAALKELQYRYRSIRVSEDPAERANRGLAVDKFADQMNAVSTLEYLRWATGLDRIDFVDAQATAYRAGDFLTNHDDAVEGKNRLAAYVLSLSPRWSIDWGGLLVLEGEESAQAYGPAFNTLRIFKVPCNHCVSIVAPWVKETRYSITGWLRHK